MALAGGQEADHGHGHSEKSREEIRIGDFRTALQIHAVERPVSPIRDKADPGNVFCLPDSSRAGKHPYIVISREDARERVAVVNLTGEKDPVLAERLEKEGKTILFRMGEYRWITKLSVVAAELTRWCDIVTLRKLPDWSGAQRFFAYRCTPPLVEEKLQKVVRCVLQNNFYIGGDVLNQIRAFAREKKWVQD